MKKSNLPVTSREYKLILNSDRFRDREKDSMIYWDLVRFLIKKHGGKIEEEVPKEESRETRYMDTPDLALSQSGFIFRVREEKNEKKKGEKIHKIVLKYRSSDRYLSAVQDVSSSKDGETKFEEDIVPPFTSKFSKSTALEMKKLPKLNKFAYLSNLFPGLKNLNILSAAPIKTVNGFIAHEVARKVAKFSFDKGLSIKAMLSFWYLLGQKNEMPLITEFSFDYDLFDEEKKDSKKLEAYPVETVKGANNLFNSLQNHVGWLDFNKATKTSFALEL